MTTKAQIRQQVGEDLALVSIGQALENQDQERIDASYQHAYEILKERGLATWAYSGEVPEKIAPYFVLLICYLLLISYSVPESRYLRIRTEAGEGGETAVQKIASLSIQEHESTDYDQGF